jgi:hypothetical protein
MLVEGQMRLGACFEDYCGFGEGKKMWIEREPVDRYWQPWQAVWLDVMSGEEVVPLAMNPCSGVLVSWDCSERRQMSKEWIVVPLA